MHASILCLHIVQGISPSSSFAKPMLACPGAMARFVTGFAPGFAPGLAAPARLWMSGRGDLFLSLLPDACSSCAGNGVYPGRLGCLPALLLRCNIVWSVKGVGLGVGSKPGLMDLYVPMPVSLQTGTSADSRLLNAHCLCKGHNPHSCVDTVASTNTARLNSLPSLAHPGVSLLQVGSFNGRAGDSTIKQRAQSVAACSCKL